MRVAVLTHVYNEVVNLPVWVAYYGRMFGDSNLYVLDHGSDDGSTSNLGQVNVIRFPHTPFSDNHKSAAVSYLHGVLLQYFDCVIISDCDEIIVPDPDKYPDLPRYIEETKPNNVVCIGLQVHHILDREPSLDLKRPILSQRGYAYFSVPASKPLISSVASRWVAGGHACSVRPEFDSQLFVFHTKFVDYSSAMKRQSINAANEWSEAQQSSGHGLHHRYGAERFFNEGFLGPMDVVRGGRVQPFNFDNETAAMRDGMEERDGMFILGHTEPKFVEIPERFRDLF